MRGRPSGGDRARAAWTFGDGGLGHRSRGGTLRGAAPGDRDADRERAHSIFAANAFSVGGADAELRCPDCASPELHWLGGPEIAEQMGCSNCGGRLARESAFLRLGDCEGILATATRPAIAAAAAVPAGP